MRRERSDGPRPQTDNNITDKRRRLLRTVYMDDKAERKLALGAAFVQLLVDQVGDPEIMGLVIGNFDKFSVDAHLLGGDVGKNRARGQ